MKLDTKLTAMLEKAARPGVLGLAGKRLENRVQEDLAGYFRKLGKEIDKVDLAKLGGSVHAADVVKHTVDMAMNNVLRRLTPDLMMVLSTGLYEAMVTADKAHPFAEAANVRIDTADPIGLSAEEAANYAAKKAGELVTGINATTRQTIADTIAKGILEQLGVEGTGRALRDLIDGFSTSRAKLIASTEINDAMSEATLRKLARLSVEYKQLISSDDACPICLSIEDAGAVPIGDPFVDDEGEEYDRTPIHPGCRCATSGARAPDEGE